MKPLYKAKAMIISFLLFVSALTVKAQVPTSTFPGICSGVVANFNNNDNGFNAPSIYGSIFDSSFYYHSGRGYWTDYLPPFRTTPPGFPRVLSIISPAFPNPNPTGTFNVGFYYITNNPVADRFQIRIISVTETSVGTVTDVQATSGVQSFAAWSTPTPYIDGVTTPVADPTVLMNGFQGNVCIRLVDPDIANAPNTMFRVEITYIVNGPTFAVFDNVSIGPSNIPLPVNFIGLVANRSATESKVDLRWDVSEEIDVREYQLEKSSTGTNFENVGTIPAKGKSIYSYTDNSVSHNTTVYYRVKSVDIDGKFKYSGILRLSGDNSYGNELTAYPVPAKDDILVQHKQMRGKAQMTLTSLNGTVLKTIFPTPGSSHTPVNISTLAPGIYLLNLTDETGYSQTTKVIKN